MKLKCGYGIGIERAQADGLISTADADELRNFSEFLKAIRGVPRPSTEWTGIYAEFYPEDYARAIAERDARRRTPTDSDATTAPAAADGSSLHTPTESRSTES